MEWQKVLNQNDKDGYLKKSHWKLFGEMIPLTTILKQTCPMCNRNYRTELRAKG